jgi:AraC-like DNA-binding protein
VTAQQASVYARLLHAVVRALRATGHDATPLLAEAAIERRDLVGVERVPHAVAERLLQRSVQLSGDPAFGLTLGQSSDPSDHGELGLLDRLPATPAEVLALQRSWVPHLHERAELHWEDQGDRVAIKIALRGLEMSRPLQDAVLAAVVHRARMLTPSAWSPLEVSFSYPTPRERAAYEACFLCPLRFGAASLGLAVPKQTFTKSQQRSTLATPGESHRSASLARTLESSDLPRRVREAVSSGRIAGRWTGVAVAEELGMSTRTLQRRLHEQGTTLYELLDTVRYELAREKLTSRANLSVIAAALGFSDARAFTRAFKRWSGVTPSAKRG